jgi:hypothetical protein
MDPMMMLASIAFPNVREKKQAPICVFAFSHVRKTAELSPEDAASRDRASSDDGAAQKSVYVPADKSPVATPPEPDTSAQSAAAPSGMIQDVDLNDILEEPDLVGDAPVPERALGNVPLVSPPVSDGEGDSEGEGENAAPATTTVSQENYQKLLEAQKELTHLREVCTAMSADVRRLMKERRQPTTDRELRDAVVQLEEKLKKTSQEKLHLANQIKERDQLVENLKGQVETLRKAKAA